MPRAIAFSAKQKREQLKDKRAVKRGELDPSEVRYARNPQGNYRAGANHRPDAHSAATTLSSAVGSTNRLQSKFTALTREYLDLTRDLAHTVPLVRPLKDESAIFPVEWMERDQGRLTCPARPKFRYDQTKKEVERNEAGMFERWLRSTKGYVEGWVEGKDEEKQEEEGDEEVKEQETPEQIWNKLRSPTWFETNLEVWRQLWRVTESSQILLLLADARCPPLHLPTSLRAYVQSLKPKKEVILILTKSDLVDPEALAGWKEWVKVWWARGYKASAQKGDRREAVENNDRGEEGGQGEEVQIVTVRNYDTTALYGDRRKHIPDMPESTLKEFILALRTAHTRLKTPPTDLKSSTKWRSPVRSDVDWDLLARGPAAAYPPANVDTTVQQIQTETGEEGEDEERGTGLSRAEREPLTIGVIGQPNVGKSSFLNAVLGESRVRAGRTPGKTKHFQSLYWGWKKDVKVVDCPGLVCPSLVGLEVQALCGILPISQIPSLPACILTAAQLLPVEEIFKVPGPPPPPEDPHADKRTWRGSRPGADEGEAGLVSEKKGIWTAGAIMDSRASDRGYITSKSGRPDGNRAANGMMLALAEGRIRWCFYPPGTPPHRQGKGIWLGDFPLDEEVHSDSASASGDSGSEDDPKWRLVNQRKAEHDANTDSDESEDDGEASEVEKKAREIDKGFFAALDMGEDEEEGEEEEEDISAVLGKAFQLNTVPSELVETSILLELHLN